jgi:predicted membrane channel-forming protein YqfA (hemolysin III family)
VEKITTIGAGTLVAIYHPKFRTSEWRPLRAFMFVAMGLSAVFPVIHGVEMYGLEVLEKKIGLSWLVGQGLLYIVGAGLYAVCFKIICVQDVKTERVTGSHTRTMVSRTVRHLGRVSSDLPHISRSGCSDPSDRLVEGL